MNIYIPEFVCGILFTVLVEILIIIASFIKHERRNRKKK